MGAAESLEKFKSSLLYRLWLEVSKLRQTLSLLDLLPGIFGYKLNVASQALYH